ncbi:MAG: hypothetical protein V1822_01825, partial [Candidatus Micrarchaeota archaeon]
KFEYPFESMHIFPKSCMNHIEAPPAISFMETDHLVVIGDPCNMDELDKKSVQLVITSPSHMNFRLIEQEGDGYLHDFEEYLSGLIKVSEECKRVLQPCKFLCLNISDTTSKRRVARGGAKQGIS